MIHKEISLQNFLSIGEKPTIIDLDSGRLSLITGKNGHGKSTIKEGIAYVYYGKPLRRDKNDRLLKLDRLVNSKNKRNMVCIGKSENKGDSYKVIRGEKPKILEIWKNGIHLDKLSSNKLMDEYIVKNIIGKDFDMFLNYDLIGKPSYKPILEMKLPSRRDLIDRTFGMNMFIDMKDKFIDLIKGDKKKKIDVDKGIVAKEVSIEYGLKLNKMAKEDRGSRIESINNEIDSIYGNIEDLEQDYKMFSYDEDYFTKIRDKLSETGDKLKAVERVLWGLSRTLKEKQGVAIGEGELSPLCPSCGQLKPIVDDTEVVKRLADEINALNWKKSREEGNYRRLIKDKEIFEEEVAYIRSKKSKRGKILAEIGILKRSLGDKEKQLKKLSIPVETDVDIDMLRVELRKLIDDRELYSERIKYFRYAKDDFLSDNGYKAFKLNAYLPTINRFINKMSDDYQLGYDIKMFDDYTFSISDMYGEADGFSGGQIHKLDLSIREALGRSASHFRNISTNLVFYDEIPDGSMDDDGKAVFIELLKKKMERDGMTGFIISHGLDNFEHNIRVTMENGFSKYHVD